MSFNIQPFCSQEFNGLFDPSEYTFLQVPDGHLYKTVCEYVIAHSNSLSSLTTTATKSQKPFDPCDTEQDETKVDLILGLGTFTFNDPTLKKEYILLHHTFVPPVGTKWGVVIYQEIIVFVAGKGPQQKTELQQFCNSVISWEEETYKNTYNIFSWSHKNQEWEETITKLTRPVDSVILPQDIKAKILEDVEDFSQPETAKWYSQHGIPYKRSFLFHGPPGTGKSSLITVMAGHLNRNVCFLQPSHPKMTDECLVQCMHEAPKNSVIVIEDIDALFSADRQTTHKSTPLTFSGLLNSLDGVANPDGQIFVLTTNYIERLDPALIRAGRVDVKVEFPSATEEQVRGMFLHFYKDASADLATEFGKIIAGKFNLGTFENDDKKRLTMAQLEQHFISCQKVSAKDAICRLTKFAPAD